MLQDEDMKKFKEETLPQKLNFLQNLMKQTGKKGFAVGSSVSTTLYISFLRVFFFSVVFFAVGISLYLSNSRFDPCLSQYPFTYFTFNSSSSSFSSLSSSYPSAIITTYQLINPLPDQSFGPMYQCFIRACKRTRGLRRKRVLAGEEYDQYGWNCALCD